MKWIGLVVVAGILALTAWALWPRPILVDMATVETGPLEVVVSDDGTTRIQEVYTVSAPVGGTLTRSPLDEGDIVTGGETVIATILPGEPTFLDARSRREAEAVVEAAQAAVNLADVLLLQAEAQHNFALSDLRRAQTLRARNTISAREMEQKELDVVRASAEMGSARATANMRRQELESAKARLIQPGSSGVDTDDETCCVTVRAPVSGVVIDVTIESEQTIAAGTPMIEIGDPDALEVVVELLSREAVRVNPGDRAWLDGWGGGTLEAVVRRVEPAARTEISALGIEEQRVEVLLDLAQRADGDARLGHNYRVVAHIVVWEDADALKVPLGALFRSGGDWAVFQVVEERAVLTPVSIGERGRTHAAVLSGLDPGATVIVHPSDTVTDNTTVAQRTAAPQ
ncbi:MAG: HlyD family efflux transporter periplasmic adaptor subunit [Pseudomonadota bacterium]